MRVGSGDHRQRIRHSKDSLFAAMRAEQEARKLHSEALRTWRRAGEFSGRRPTPAEVQWRLYRLHDLDEARASAARKALQAQSFVLATKPTTHEECAALLAFARRILGADPRLKKVTEAIANVEATLLQLGP